MLNAGRYQLLKILTLPLIMLLLVFTVSSTLANTSNNTDDKPDLLAYTVKSDDGVTALMLYNPHRAESTKIVSDAKSISFSFSPDGRLAYSIGTEANPQIYVVDRRAADNSPVNISQNASTNYPLAWSHDGRYLVFASNDPDGRIYIWDGDQSINIFPPNFEPIYNPTPHYFSWSFDGRLAFTVWYHSAYPSEGDISEIYLWDGHTTTSLSQNPTGRDEAATWNLNGQLAFLSARNNEYDIFVWDGSTVKNGAPDIGTFTNIAPELTDYFSFPTWTNEGLLAFSAYSDKDSHAQIYLQAGQMTTNISQNPSMHNGSETWNTNGLWAFTTFFSLKQLIHIRDTDNHPLLSVEGQSPAWDSNSKLLFCAYQRPDWILSIWNKQHILKVDQGREILAQWQSGSRCVCSSG